MIDRDGYDGSPRNEGVSNLHALWGSLSLGTEEDGRAEAHAFVDDCVENRLRSGAVEVGAGKDWINLLAQSVEPLWVQGEVDQQECQGSCSGVTSVMESV